MDLLEQLEQDILEDGIVIEACALPGTKRGLYYNSSSGEVILMDRRKIRSRRESIDVLMEERGHYFTSTKDLLDPSLPKEEVLRQEGKAKNWACERYIPLEKLVMGYLDGIRSLYCMGDYCEVEEDLIIRSFYYYKSKFPYGAMLGNYNVYFTPAFIVEGPFVR